MTEAGGQSLFIYASYPLNGPRNCFPEYPVDQSPSLSLLLTLCIFSCAPDLCPSDWKLLADWKLSPHTVAGSCGPSALLGTFPPPQSAVGPQHAPLHVSLLDCGSPPPGLLPGSPCTPRGSSQLSITPAPGDLTPLWRQNSNAHKIEINLTTTQRKEFEASLGYMTLCPKKEKKRNRVERRKRISVHTE